MLKQRWQLLEVDTFWPAGDMLQKVRKSLDGPTINVNMVLVKLKVRNTECLE